MRSSVNSNWGSQRCFSRLPSTQIKKVQRWENDLDVLVAELGRLINPSDKFLLGFDPEIITNIDEKIGKAATKTNFELIENDKGALCLFHDKKVGPTFGTIPFFIVYHIDKKVIELVFNTGFTMPLDFGLSDETHQTLIKAKNILMVRMNEEKAAEGFELALLKCKDGKTIDDSAIQQGTLWHFHNMLKKVIGKWK